ncbi:hypothetical protein KFK09_003175 [Dendrobium nobile]|uniref:Uncharacterized protein n=1 Tax=Dendrobium nobile TaxID=94219 RepID=A0A8T3C3G2_DENNO|nr:hypothetical protein KFK09_003175 [Dendrobium nobile]
MVPLVESVVAGEFAFLAEVSGPRSSRSRLLFRLISTFQWATGVAAKAWAGVSNNGKLEVRHPPFHRPPPNLHSLVDHRQSSSQSTSTTAGLLPVCQPQSEFLPDHCQTSACSLITNRLQPVRQPQLVFFPTAVGLSPVSRPPSNFRPFFEHHQSSSQPPLDFRLFFDHRRSSSRSPSNFRPFVDHRWSSS